MPAFSVGHLADHVLVRETRALVARQHLDTAALLAHLAEIDARRLYADHYDSMYAWCLAELHLSEDAAARRLTAARCARKHPALLAAVADGRLHLSAVGLLAAHLTAANRDELIAMATHRSKSGIEHLLAERFPRPDVPTVLRPIGPLAPPQAASEEERVPNAAGTDASTLAAVATPLATGPEHVPGRMEVPEMSGAPSTTQEAPRATTSSQPAPAAVPVRTHARLTPLAPERYAFQLTLDRETHDLLRAAQALLGHAVPSGDLAQVLKRALQELVAKLGKRKGAVARAPQARKGGPSRRLVANERYIPDRLKNAVWQRDQGRCTHVGSNRQRCQATTRLEIDHVTPITRGGQATLANLRLLCHTHNRRAANQALGTAYMQGRIQQTQAAAAERTQRDRNARAPARE